MNIISKSAILIALVLPGFHPADARQTADGNSRNQGRIAPPVTLTCDRSQLTSYAGKVVQYRRDANSTDITIQTEWDTQESLVLNHPAPDEVQNYFLLQGQVFNNGDWTKIEASEGILHKDIRLIAWVCEDGETPAILDWRP